ncbi:hypothetical protein K431DRAFT_123373 [Polychaeton citri CBS 116435]|uniref:Zn(2)-C6 fungal-type domain-containing protein n=1 Tax=Polychaeton citri CBS 116435 TaxID=1314669 RepID=A0A9P4UNH3_9PEZI|nr:hypothetical protein K431DRAFT_123373 [Polychaeton citri CBS 116435]
MSLHIVFEQPGALSRDPKLRTRRAHTKSRQGCRSCKTKRIKCDETKPDCTQCMERSLKCEYPAYAPVSSVGTDSQTASARAADRGILKAQILDFTHEVTPSCPVFVNPIYKPEDDFTLLDHFLECSEPWLGSKTFQTILLQHVVQWSTEHPPLLQATLAAAAAHLHTLHPDQVQWRIATAFHYNHATTRFLARFQDGLESTEAEAIFATGYLLLITSMSNVLEVYDETVQQQNLTTATAVEQQWSPLQSACGLATLFDSPVLAPTFEQGVWRSFREEWLHLKWLQSPETHLGSVRPTENDIVKIVEAAMDFSEDEATLTCRRPIWVLGELLRTNSEQDRSAKMTTWLATLPYSYLTLLKKHSIVAMMGIAAWCTLAFQGGQWWLNTFAQKLMEWIQAMARSQKEQCRQNDGLLNVLEKLAKQTDSLRQNK